MGTSGDVGTCDGTAALGQRTGLRKWPKSIYFLIVVKHARHETCHPGYFSAHSLLALNALTLSCNCPHRHLLDSWHPAEIKPRPHKTLTALPARSILRSTFCVFGTWRLQGPHRIEKCSVGASVSGSTHRAGRPQGSPGLEQGSALEKVGFRLRSGQGAWQGKGVDKWDDKGQTACEKPEAGLGGWGHWAHAPSDQNPARHRTPGAAGSLGWGLRRERQGWGESSAGEPRAVKMDAGRTGKHQTVTAGVRMEADCQGQWGGCPECGQCSRGGGREGLRLLAGRPVCSTGVPWGMLQLWPWVNPKFSGAGEEGGLGQQLSNSAAY